MKTLITRIKRLALALCFVTPLVSWAATEMTNPVTGETETYVNTYTGTNGSWNEAENWDTGSIPYVSGGEYTSALVDGGGTETEVTGTSIDGWGMKLGVYGGAKVTISGLAKWTGGNGTDYASVDSSSKLTITSMEANNWNHVVNYYVASPGGITYTCAFAPANDAATIQYNFAGNGSVVYESTVNKAGHLIKAADVTLSGSATPSVKSKTLVSFTSTTKTFTADAAIKVYGIDGETLVDTVNTATVNTTGETTLTEESAVGSCELVQTSTGIELYFVDGDPSAIVAKTYKPSISVNFTSGTALSTAADVGVGDYAVPGTSWNNLIGNNGTLSTVTQVDSTGAASTVAGVGVTISGTRGYWTCGSVTAATDLRQGYIDDAAGANASPQVVVSGIPYYSYYAVVYFSNNSDNVKFGYVTINGTNYKWDDTTSALVECDGADTDSWGASSPTAWTEGGNYIVTPTIVNADGTFTIVSHRLSGSIRSGIAAIQIVEVPKIAAADELVINVSGDTPYTVSEDAAYTTVYVTGVGTLAFDGEGTITTTTLNVGVGATVPMGSSITPTTVTGAGTVVYDGAQPSTTVGFDDSANWFGTVWVKNVGSNGESSKVSTVLGTDTATATDNVLKDWGNENSSVKFTNVRGWTGTAVCPWTLILEDDGTNYAWYNNNGYAARSTTFAALKGSGTFYDKSADNKPCRQKITFTDGSQFTGALYAEGKRVGLGGENTRSDVEDNNGTIEVVSGATATVASGKTWTAGTGSILVTGTLYANGTLAGTSTTRAVRGSGTVVFAGKMPSPTTDAWWKNAAWTGTVQMKSVTLVGTSLAFNDYGNTGSVLELNGCSGWLTPAYTCTVPLKITGTLTLNDGYSNKDNAFKVGTLLGDGTISGSSNAPTMVFNVTTDWSNFTGKVQLTNKCVVFGSSIPDLLTEGRIYISEGAQVTVQNTADAGWWAVGGIQVDGELRANSLARFGGGTNITTGDTGVFTLVSNSDTDDMNVDYTRIQGTGTLKFEGTNYRTISTNNFPTALVVENNLNNGLIHRIPNLEVTIGSLSGSGQMRSDWGGSGSSGDRDLRILQAKDTTYSGLFASTNDRIDEVYVAPGESTAGTLTLSGAQTASNGLIVETGASVNLTGTWKGATTVAGTIGGTGTLTGNLTFSEGATFKAFAADDADGLVVSGTVTCPAEGTVTVDVSAIEPETDVALLKAADLDASKFVLADGTPEGYSLDVVDGVLTLKVPVTKVTITVPAVENATVAVTVGGVAVQPITEGGTTYSVLDGAAVVVTYTAAEGYAIEGTASFSFNASEGYTVDTTGTTAAQYVVSMTVNNVTTKYTTLQAALNAITLRQQRVVLLANETAGATVPAGTYSFYIIPGEFTYGTIAFPEGDYITSVTETSVKKDEGSSDLIPAVAYTCAPADIIVTVGAVRSLYSMTDSSTAIAAATAGGAGSTVKFVNGGASYREFMESSGFEYDSENDIYTLAAVPVAAVYNGQVLINNFTSLAAAVEAAEAGQTVKLLADVDVSDEGVTFPADTTLTLDLNNCTLTAANTATGHIQVNGVLTITDSSEGAGGKIVSGTSGTYGVVQVAEKDVTGASLTIAGGAIEAYFEGETDSDGQHPAYGVVVKGTGTSFTMTGGSITAGYMALMGHGSKASAGTYNISGGTITSMSDFAAYFPTKGDCAVTISGGTFSGLGGVSARAGTVTITGGVFTASGAGTAPGSSPGTTGLGFMALAVTPNYGNVTVSVSGGTFTSATDVAAVMATTSTYTGTISLTGGTYSTDVSDYCATGYEATEDNGVWVVAALPNYTVTFDADGGTPAPAAQTVQKGSTATVPTAPTKADYTFAGWTLGGSAYDFATPVTGNITLVASWTAVSSGIDPTDPTSTQEVTVDTSLTAEEQEAAAIEAATVTVPDGVSGVDAATYKTYFTYSATPTATAGTYDVAITGFADEVTETADGNALAALEAATAGGTLSAEVAVKPGLYYGTVAGDDVTTLKAPAGTLNTTGTLDLSGVTKPSTGEAFFIKIKVSTTNFAAEE